MSSQLNTEFGKHSTSIAIRFLQTVMVVDDRAYFVKEESSGADDTLIAPGAPEFIEATPGDGEDSEVKNDRSVKESNAASKEESHSNNAETDLAHELDARQLIESFAERGILCAVIRPKDGEIENLGSKVHPLSESSDIVVFDWVLHQDKEGGTVTQLISEITKQSADVYRRTRLIVVYTGQAELREIADQLEKKLKEANAEETQRADQFTIVRGPVRIAIYAKEHVRVDETNKELGARVIPIDKLPDILIGEFAQMTIGLVSNVALESFAALRLNTHHVLSKFHSGIDAPFLAHRAMLPHPEDAGDLLAYLVGAEITALLSGQAVGNQADTIGDLDIINAWLEMHEADGYQFAQRFKVKASPQVLVQINTLLRKGVADEALEDPFASFKKDPHKKALTARLSKTAASANDLEHEFAVLTSLKSDYDARAPVLFPGTLLKETIPARGLGGQESYRYFVSIQPVCDCVRIKTTRAFPFLELEVIDENKTFDLVLPDKDKGFVHVRVAYRPHKLIMKDFEPSNDGSEMVRGERRDGRVVFTASNGASFGWIGELKFQHSQRIVNNYAAELSRVGLDEAEWLRRWAG